MNKNLRELLPEEQGFHKVAIDGIDPLSYMSVSKIKAVLESPKHFYDRYILGNKPAETPAKRRGKMFHRALLEPDKVDRFVVKKKFSGDGARTREREWLENLRPGSVVVTQAELDDLLSMMDSLTMHPTATKLLRGGDAEVPTYWYDTKFKTWFHSFFDYVAPAWIAETKTTKCANPKAFGRDFYDLGYYIQAAVYSDGYEIITGRKMEFFPVIAIESSRPFVTEVYTLPDHVLDHGRTMRDLGVRLIQENLHAHREKARRGERHFWPGYSGVNGNKNGDPVDLDLPGWAKYELESMEANHVGG